MGSDPTAHAYGSIHTEFKILIANFAGRATSYKLGQKFEFGQLDWKTVRLFEVTRAVLELMTWCHLSAWTSTSVPWLPDPPPPPNSDLAELEDSSCADVFPRMQLHRRVLALLVQLQDGDPQLDPAGHLVPPADSQQGQVSCQLSGAVSRFRVCILGSTQYAVADTTALRKVLSQFTQQQSIFEMRPRF